ncbi:hypothetical protein HPB49_003691 [Dermacentor silvarum]|uniref:Uncharacterized protein n=1 Tax=Dermacentor silvarum TaxID=543639 RepID=A0ACB8DU50_DERSI|nr:hypothetical protein HPB49_003691 [Dermacentor silvarum]
MTVATALPRSSKTTAMVPSTVTSSATRTKWCGAGNVAKNYDDLGSASATDTCCRDHDHSEDSIPAFGTEHGITNYMIYTIVGVGGRLRKGARHYGVGRRLQIRNWNRSPAAKAKATARGHSCKPRNRTQGPLRAGGNYGQRSPPHAAACPWYIVSEQRA